jgi:hypothetical protein
MTTNRRRTLGGLIAVMVTVIGNLGGLVAVGAATPRPLITLPVVRQAFATTWPGFSSAFDHKNLAKVSTYGTPEMAEAVLGYYSCGCTTWALQGISVRFSVPSEQQYPLSFLAEVTGRDANDERMTEEAVLTKASPVDRWRVAYMVDLENTNHFLGTSAVQPAPLMPFDITIVGGELSDFFDSVVNTGEPPEDDNWPLTGALKQLVYHDLGVKEVIEKEGNTQQATFVPGDHSAAFAYPSGDIMCGTIDSTAVVTTPTGYVTVQPEDRSNWGPLLPPGKYTTLTKTGVEDYCFTNTTGGLTTPISFFGGIDQIVGSPG